MKTAISKEIQCVVCSTPFTPALEPEEGEEGYLIYCSSKDCANKIFMSVSDPVRVSLREVFELSPDALALAVQEVLADCPCGGRFSHDGGRRCSPCIKEIGMQKTGASDDHPQSASIWNAEELNKVEQKLIGYILKKIESGEETLGELVERYESGEIRPEEYMEEIETIRCREAVQLAVIKTWAMALGLKTAFRAAEELELVERYGSRILVTIASGLQASTGYSLTSILSKEVENWDGLVQKEIKTYLSKIGGG